MSASSKKKLRKEAAAAGLTERQIAEQAEAKKLKNITVTFVVIMLVVAVAAAAILIGRTVNNSGIIDKNTVAAVTGEHELDSIQVNYYLTDTVRNMYQQMESMYGESTSMYLAMSGFAINDPLNEQIANMETGETWADHYLKEALEQAKSDYTLYDMAMAEGFKLSEDEQKALNSNTQMLELYAAYSGFASVDKYLKAIYGAGADLKSYEAYAEISTIAAAYYNQKSDSLSYNDVAIREKEKDNFEKYSSFSYAVYSVNSADYLSGGTKDENGTTNYSEDERAAALKAAEDIANQLKASTSLEAFNKAIAELEINKDKKDAASTLNDDVRYTQITESYREWLSDDTRKANDITVIANETTTTDVEGNEQKYTSGYSVVLFIERNDNLRHLANVRHLLIKFEGGTTDANGNKTYSAAEMQAAKTEAERLLQVWKDGNATEETFIELVKEHSDDGSASEGGLFEDIHPESQYVPSFLSWSLDTARKTGDTGVIVSDYGYHVMYYVGDDELTYRDYMISEDLRSADMEKWYKEILEPITITQGKTNRLNLDLVLSNII